MNGGRTVYGIDLGGTSVKAVAIRGDRRTPIVRIPTEANLGRDRIIANIERAVGTLGERFGEFGSPEAIGIGTPGVVDRTGRIDGHAVNFSQWGELSPSEYASRRFGVGVVVENDGNLASLAEYELGAGRGFGTLVCVFLGTGIGGGIVIDGKVVPGAGGGAGEIGHLTVEPGGEECGCGRRGCLERYASASGLVLQAIRLSDEVDSPLARRIRAGADEVTAELLYRELANGDALALRVHDRSCEMLARALGAVCSLIDPEAIVLGGGVMRAGSVILDGVRERIGTYALPWVASRLSMFPAGLGDEAGAIGAAVAAKRFLGG